MIEKLTKNSHRFYQYSFIFVITLTLGTLVYFWNLGFIDGEKSQNLYQAGYILESFQDGKPIEEVKTHITNENPKLAIEKLKEIENDLEFLNRIHELNEYDDLKKDIQRLKTSSANLISFSKVSKVIGVFNAKLNKFYQFSKEKKWRTLARLSDRISSRTQGHINKGKLSNLVEGIQSDFNNMIKVSENSVLSRAEKSEVKSRIQNLNFEMNMLKKYIEERTFFYGLHKEIKSSTSKWISNIAPAITLQKVKMNQMGTYYLFGLLGICLVTSIILILGGFVQKYFSKKSNLELEEHLQMLLTNHILEGQSFDFSGYSQEFEGAVENISGYIHKRMSFGSIFQDAMPFSSILLDENLKVRWANKQFCDDWMISEKEIHKDFVSWDYLNKLTNLGHNDPVIEALKNNIAGIYQLQLKPNDKVESKPFEMFVSPVKYQGKTKIMLIFYNLESLEQTIQDQAISLISPIHRSLDLKLEGEQIKDEDLAYEYSIAGIDDVYDKFLNLEEKYQSQEKALVDEIEKLNFDLDNLKNRQAEFLSEAESALKYIYNGVSALKAFKENVIQLTSRSHETNRLLGKEYELLNANLNALKVSAEKQKILSSICQEFFGLGTDMEEIKKSRKNLRNQYKESSNKLNIEIKNLSEYLHSSTGQFNPKKIMDYVDKISNRFHQSISFIHEMEKEFSGVELILSKAQMISSAGEAKVSQFDLGYEVSQIELSQAEAKVIKKYLQEANIELEENEKVIIENLKGMFNATKSSLHSVGQMKSQEGLSRVSM